MMRRSLAALLIAAALSACGPGEPLRVGFIGGLSDRSSDIGEAGRNGVILAMEQRNAAGGINGRLIELVVRDDAQNRETAAKAAAELVAARVDVVIGPFTSGVAAVAVPVIDRAGILTISPTITSMDFYGKDDKLIRINRTTRDNAQDYAGVMFSRGLRKLAVAYDVRNRSFSESWLNEFRTAFSTLGGTLATETAFEALPDAGFAEVVGKLVASNPDGLVFIASAIDVARLAQQARKQAPALPLGASEWAASEQILELGGKSVEGLLIVQSWDRSDESPRYRLFHDAYLKRFQREPGYSSVAAYDAAIVAFSAMGRRASGESVKAAVLKNGPYEGLQQQIAFDPNGDTTRKVFFTEIHGGQFVLVK